MHFVATAEPFTAKTHTLRPKEFRSLQHVIFATHYNFAFNLKVIRHLP